MSEYGIIYKCFKIRDNLYVLDPKKLIEGYQVGDDFYHSEIKPYKIAESLKDNDPEYVVDGITSLDVLFDFYDCYDDEELVKDFYFVEQEEFLVVVEIKDGQVLKRKINRKALFESKQIEIYDMSEVEPFVLIDSSTIAKLKAERDITAIKKKLETLEKRLVAAKNLHTDRVNGVTITNDQMTEVKVNDMDADVKIAKPTPAPTTLQTSTPKKETTYSIDFTLRGLELYIKERILGHDEEVRKIATIVYDNYKATEEDTIQSILIPGPTGVGKTETARLVCKYLGVPYKEIDCSTLVPEGIVGTRLGDELRQYVIEAEYNLAKAHKGILILDEFDKIALTGLDIKAAARFELLKFIEGKKYTFERKGLTKDPFILDTSRLMKFFLGAFGDTITTSKKTIGFSPTPVETVEDVEQKIIDNTRFEKELLSRIQITIPYKNLTPEDKKRIILFSKGSIYAEKKRRLLRDYGVTISGDEEYAEGVLEAINANKEGIRQMNNIIFSSFLDIMYELGTNEGKYKTLVLSRDTVSKKRFDLS